MGFERESCVGLFVSVNLRALCLASRLTLLREPSETDGLCGTVEFALEISSLFQLDKSESDKILILFLKEKGVTQMRRGLAEERLS